MNSRTDDWADPSVQMVMTFGKRGLAAACSDRGLDPDGDAQQLADRLLGAGYCTTDLLRGKARR